MGRVQRNSPAAACEYRNDHRHSGPAYVFQSVPSPISRHPLHIHHFDPGSKTDQTFLERGVMLITGEINHADTI